MEAKKGVMIQAQPPIVPGWQTKKLADCAELVREHFDPNGDVEMPYVGLEHIGEGMLRLVGHGRSSDVTSGKFLFMKGDILFGKLRPYFRKVIIAPFDGICSTDISVIRAKVGTDQRFLFYWLASSEFIDIATGSSTGTRMPRADWDFLLNLESIVPSFPEQHSIGEVLSALDDKIKLNERMNHTLEAIAQAIFKSWFVDFDPVKAKSEGRDTGLPKEIDELFPDSFEESELGPIPEGWKIRSIGEVVRCVGGSTPSTKEPRFWEGGTNPFVTPKDMSALTSPVIFDTERHITDTGVERISSGRLPVGTLLLSSRAPIGYLATTEVPVSVNQGIIAMICEGELPNYYVLRWVEANMDIIKANAGGTTFAEISKKNFRPISVVVPPSETVFAFVQQVKPLQQRIVINVKEINVLAITRDTLLPKLLSGEIRVREAHKFVEGVV